MADAIALIVAGTGETTEREVNDLLMDAYPEETYEEIGLIVPVDKDLFSKTVGYVVAWFNNDADVVPIQTNGASLTRGSSKLGSDGTQKVDKFAQILTKSDFEDWDQVHFLVAMPEDEEDPDYDYYAELVETAIDNGLVVKNLCRGLDDVTLAEPEDAVVPEPEKVEEPVAEEKPAPKRRSRAKAKPEPEAEAGLTLESAPDGVPIDRDNPDFSVPAGVTGPDIHGLIGGVIEALSALQSAFTPAVAPEATPEPEKPAEAPARGRGRPRQNFEVPQIYDEDAEEWIPRPKGRVRKGTQWRKIHAESGDVLEEGTA